MPSAAPKPFLGKLCRRWEGLATIYSHHREVQTMCDRAHRARAATSEHALSTHAGGACRHTRTQDLLWACRACKASTGPCPGTPWAVWGRMVHPRGISYGQMIICHLEPINCAAYQIINLRRRCLRRQFYHAFACNSTSQAMPSQAIPSQALPVKALAVKALRVTARNLHVKLGMHATMHVLFLPQ